LGVNAFHGDSSACLLDDGKIIAAAEEERFRRIKHWAGFPSESIRYCLEEAGIRLKDVAHIAINQDTKANLGKKVAYTLAHRPDLNLVLDRIRNKKERVGIKDYLAESFPEDEFIGTVHAVEHHLAHLSSAFHVSPFDSAVVLSVDGFGDFASAAWGVGNGIQIDIEERIYFPHSLGVFYQALTQFLGFPHYGDEYKIMGLAPYGEPRYMDQMRRIVQIEKSGKFRLNLDFFRHHEQSVQYEWDDGAPVVGELYSSSLADLLGPARGKDEPLEQHHKDIARSIQAMYEEAFFNILRALFERHDIDSLALAGGCAMNSVANGKIRRSSSFKRVYVQSAAGDAGGAIGAAYSVWHKIGSDTRSRFGMDHAYWGPSFDGEDVQKLIQSRHDELMAKGCEIVSISDEEELCSRTAQAIADGKVIGWFQGRMEWGPRALGNRSILCDPRRADMKDILNRKIKRRESFLPFAPSILREAVNSWFEEDDDVPFMMKVFQVREDQRAKIPAVVHVDGSGRLQTVASKTNPRYHKLISKFFKQTGVPIVLNTSFNENEPVVCKPDEALDCFLRTNMDVLVLGNVIVSRN
jgi:carbamoyltransferase